MKLPFSLLSLVLVAMSCTGQRETADNPTSKTGDSSPTVPAAPAPANDPPASSNSTAVASISAASSSAAATPPGPVTGSESSSNQPCSDSPAGDCAASPPGNMVTSGEKVTVTLGSFGVFKSSETIAHMYQRGDGTQPDRVYLRTVLSDCSTSTNCKGTTIEFHLDYRDETTPIDLAQHGALILTQNGVELLASQGQVTVTTEGNGRLQLTIDGLEMGRDTADAGIVSPQHVAPALIEGLTERICVNADGTARDPSNPFCSVTD
jgi:hypothetical protein